MSKIRFLALALAGTVVVSTAHGQYADSVTVYTPGSGFVAGYADATSALGQPSRVTPGDWGGGVDPFNPPWQPSQLVSVGTGGSLTVYFNTPILNASGNPFGIDLIIFGNSGFIDTAWPRGIADGSLLGNNTGETRVSVSADGVVFYALNPMLAPVVDGMYPTDGSGNFFQPVNPALTSADFAGKDLAAIRTLYGGSGGGTGYNLAWALNGNGQSVSLLSASYVRVEVLNGIAEIDGFAVVPEPAAGLLGVAGAVMLFLKRRPQH